MDKFLYNTSLGVYNRARRLVGRKWINPAGFNINLPEDRLNRMFRSFTSELEEKLSLPFGLKFRHRWLQSSTNKAEAYVLESALASELIANYDHSLALEILSPFLNNQGIEGNIPIHVRPMGTSRFSAGPYLFNALWELGRAGDYGDAKKLCEKMGRLASWLTMHKKNIEGLFSHKDAEWFRTAPCLTELRRAHTEVIKDYDDVRSVSFNSLIVMQMRVMSKIARSCGIDSDADRYEDTAAQLSDRINEILWDEESGFYYDLVGGSVVRDMSLGGFLPLAGEIPDKRQVSRMLEWLPMISDRISLIGTDPAITPMFGLVVDGLIKYGKVKEASGVAMSVIEHVSDQGDSGKYFLPRAQSLVMLIKKIAGFNRYPDRYVLFPKLPEKWAEMPVRINDGINDLRLTLTLRSGGMVDVKISGTPGMVYENSIPNYRFKSIPLPLYKNPAKK